LTAKFVRVVLQQGVIPAMRLHQAHREFMEFWENLFEFFMAPFSLE